MKKLASFLGVIFKIQGVFHICSMSQFRRVTFRVLTCDSWPLD